MGVVLALLGIGILVGGFMFWYFHRPLPPEVTAQPLFQGITYTRMVQTDPIPQIIHLAEIDLTADGLSFLVTPSGSLEDFDFEGQMTSQFLDAHALQLAINGDFFDPWKDYGIFNYYPHVGDGTNVRGLSASQGEITTVGYVSPRYYVSLYISRDNRATFDAPYGDIYNAISGNMYLVRNGEIVGMRNEPYIQKRHPRTAVGLSQDETTLYWVVIDGRQPNYSEGATMLELAQILRDAGAHTAINLDGGGSSTLVMDDNGAPNILNSPIQSRLPARERPIANHIGVYAKPLP